MICLAVMIGGYFDGNLMIVAILGDVYCSAQ
jgi:hypothetical protein